MIVLILKDSGNCCLSSRLRLVDFLNCVRSKLLGGLPSIKYKGNSSMAALRLPLLLGSLVITILLFNSKCGQIWIK